MGKKSKRDNKTNKTKGARLHKAATHVPQSALFSTVLGLLKADKFDEIRKIESQYQHADLDPFSDDSDGAFVAYAFGTAHYESQENGGCLNRATHNLERARQLLDSNPFEGSETDFMRRTVIQLALCYSSDGRDMEKAISCYRWILENCDRDHVQSECNTLLLLGKKLMRFKRYDYAIEVLEEILVDMLGNFSEVEQFGCFYVLVHAYIEFKDFLKAKTALKEFISVRPRVMRENGMLPSLEGRAEFGLCNYNAAIHHFKNATESEQRVRDNLKLGQALLRRRKGNEVEAFQIFQTEMNDFFGARFHTSLDIELEEILLCMGVESRKLKKWSQSIEYLEKLIAIRESDTMQSQANKAMAETYLEQYCTDTTLDIDQRTQILQLATTYAQSVDVETTDMHLIRAQLFYVNDGDKQHAYQQLELYLDVSLLDCKLKCYTCDQRIRSGSVPFSCACCKVASYCDRRHQKMTWKKERICHRVLCPLLGYWRKAKKRQRRNGSAKEDLYVHEMIFDTFFESICPSVNSSDPSYFDG